MKIAYFNCLYDIEDSSVGAGIHVKELANALNDLGNTVTVYNMNRFNSVESSTRKKWRSVLKGKLKLDRYFNQINSLLSNFRYFIKVWKIVHNEPPDVILMRYHRLNFTMLVFCKMKKIPLVLEVNAPLSYEYRKYCKHILQLPIIPEFIEWINLRLADDVIVVSNQLKKYYEKWKIKSNKIHFVINGSDVDKFLASKMDNNILSNFKSKQNIVLGFIGSFHYWHGIDNLFRFIESTLESYKNVSFLLVGPGPLKDKLMKRVERANLSDKVYFTDYVPHEDIPKYLNLMDIVMALYPKMDFFYFSPLKLFEYMAAGKAIVASNIGQISEIVEDGKNGMLFEPDNFDEMRRKVFNLIEDRDVRDKIGEQARIKILRNYTWRHTAQKVAKILAESSNRSI